MKLGELKKVSLREIWKREDTDFTNWLSREDNISLLLDDIGISAENIKKEDKAGKYSCDITADELDTGKKIIIENQLEATDHKHLGQLLTYASSFDASIIIWVVARANDEHKQAIEWFNRNMTEKISFFLVKIELWRIGNSEPAPKFNILVEPNEFLKIHNQQGSQKLTKRKLIKIRFWEGLISYSDDKNSILSFSRKARPNHWYAMKTGFSGTWMAFLHNSRTNQISTEICINESELFQKYTDNKNEFEKLCDGYEIDWRPLINKKVSKIMTHLNCDVNNENNWPNYYKWCMSSGEKLLTAFQKLHPKNK